MDFVTITKGTILYRIETSEASKFDYPKFYAYHRIPENCDPKMWSVGRCVKYCRFLKVRVKKPLRLLNVPYKTITYDEKTSEDEMLARILKKKAENVYKDDKEKLRMLNRAVNDLILQQADAGRPGERSSDWILSTFMCDSNLNGMVRFAEGIDSPSCYDGIALCKSEKYLEVIEDAMIDIN